MPTTPYCSMDSRGLLYDPVAIVDARLVDYFYTLRSQDSNFKNYSLIYDLARSNNNEDSIATNISESLTRMIQPYFDQVDIQVIPVTDEDTNQIKINIGISVIDEGTTYNIGRELLTRNSQLMAVTELNN